MSMIERQLPNNVPAEKGVLGSIIIDPEALVQVVDFLHSGHFYRDAHRYIYEAILYLYARNEPADFITITERLERIGKLKDVGGEDYLISLINQVPTSGNVEYYAKIVRDTAIRRRLIEVGGKIVAEAYSSDNAALALEEAQRTILQIESESVHGDFVSDSVILTGIMNKLEMMQQGGARLAGIPSGFSRLDYLTGGLQRSDLIVVAGRPGAGKSSLMTSMIRHQLQHSDVMIGLVTLEMSAEQVMQRLISVETDVATKRLRTGEVYDEDWDRILDAYQRLSTNRLWIDETANLSIDALGTKLRRLVSQQGLDVLYVDYIQLMSGAPDLRANRVLEIGDITKRLKGFAKEFNIAIVAGAQLSRGVESRTVKVPQLSDLRESGAIENDADIVGFIYRDAMYNTESPRGNIADFLVAKHRNGPVGEIALGFIPHLTLFRDLEDHELPISLSEYFAGRD